jgi:hypothetical protein
MKTILNWKSTLATAIIGLALAGGAQASIVTNGNFEADSSGRALPTGWTQGGTSTYQYYISPDNSPFTNLNPVGSRLLQLEGMNQYGANSLPNYIYQTFTQTSATQVSFNFDFNNADVTKTNPYMLMFDNPGNGASGGFYIGNNLTVLGNSDTVLSSLTLASYTWYSVRGTFDYTANTFTGGVYTVAGGSTPVATFSDSLRGSGAVGVSRVYLGDFNNSAAGTVPTVYIDNIALTAVPEPSTLAAVLGGAGMLAMFRRRRS